jgi:phage gp36-like protein
VAYAIAQDLVDRFGNTELIQLTDKDPHTGAVNAVLLQAAIDDAAAEIDTYLAKCFVMPIAGTVQLFKKWNCDIARYRLYDSVRLDVNNGGSDHEARRRYSDFLEQAKNVCSLNVYTTLGVKVPKVSSFSCEVQKKDSVFTNKKSLLPSGGWGDE